MGLLAPFFKHGLLELKQLEFAGIHCFLRKVGYGVSPFEHLTALLNLVGTFFEELQLGRGVVLDFVELLNVFLDLDHLPCADVL